MKKRELEVCLITIGLSVMLIGCGSKVEVPQESPTEVVNIIESKDEYKTEMLEKPYDAVIKGDTILSKSPDTDEKIVDLPQDSKITVVGKETLNDEEVDIYYCRFNDNMGYVDGEYINHNAIATEDSSAKENQEQTAEAEVSVSEEVESNIEESSSIADSSNIVEDSQNKQEDKEQASSQPSGVSENTQQSAQEPQNAPQSQADMQQSVSSQPQESVSQDNTASSSTSSILTPEEQAFLDSLPNGTVTEYAETIGDGSGGNVDDSNAIFH